MTRAYSLFLIAVLTLPASSLNARPTLNGVLPGGPALLTFEELVSLYENGVPSTELGGKLERLLSTPFVDNRASEDSPADNRARQNGAVMRVAHWNIERGIAFEDIEAAFKGRETFAERMKQLEQQPEHEQRTRALQEAEMLSQADVIVLNEVDWGLKRSGYRNVARELAAALGMNYAFGVEFVEVDPLTLGIAEPKSDENGERDALIQNLAVDRELTVGLHGNAILSRYPLKNVRIIRFQTEGHDWYEGEKNKVAQLEKGKRQATRIAFLEEVLREVRRGGRMMMLAEIEDPGIPGGRATIVNAHLEARTKPSNRRRQLEEGLAAIKAIDHPVILAGDLNTSGSDATPTSIPREVRRRLGDSAFWAQRAIKWATGFGLLYDVSHSAFNFGRRYGDPTVRNVWLLMQNSEARFFETLEGFRFADGGAFDFRGSAERSADGRGGTLANSNERAMKGFKPTYEPERSFKLVRLKLDWIFVKPPGSRGFGHELGSYVFAPQHGRTLQALNYSLGDRLSDHSPMIVDLPLATTNSHATTRAIASPEK